MKKRVLFVSAAFLCLFSTAEAAETAPRLATATFAGGCFWCMQPPFDKTPGVVSSEAGYTGGSKRNPAYEEVSAGLTGHAEAVRVLFDPAEVSYEKLLGVFWRSMDPTDAGGQFADRGSQYRPIIFYHSEEQRRLAQGSKKALAESGRFSKPIATAIQPAREFYPAEEYHQKYYLKNPASYQAYRKGSGREAFLEKVWGRDAGH